MITIGIHSFSNMQEKKMLAIARHRILLLSTEYENNFNQKCHLLFTTKNVFYLLSCFTKQAALAKNKR